MGCTIWNSDGKVMIKEDSSKSYIILSDEEASMLGKRLVSPTRRPRGGGHISRHPKH